MAVVVVGVAAASTAAADVVVVVVVLLLLLLAGCKRASCVSVPACMSACDAHMQRLPNSTHRERLNAIATWAR